MSIKMICSDLDGTILTYTQTEITKRMSEQIRELKERGILFVPASGRQIVSMQKLFQPVKDCCNYICSNGAVICDGEGNVLEKQAMLRERAIEIAYDFWENTDGKGEVNLAGATCCHLWSRGLGMEDRLRFIGNKYELIQKPEDIADDIVKVSVFLPDGAVNYVDRFLDKWAAYNPAIAGPYWIDTTLSNKGSGVKRLCDRLHIPLKDVVAFGDNYNDVTMLDIVGHPYIMSSATGELLERYKQHTESVEDSLDEILKGL